MTNPGTKLFKLLLSFGLCAYWLYHEIVNDSFTLMSIASGFALVSIVYLISTLFGLALSFSRNYIIAIAISVVVLLFIAGKLDDLVAAIPWLTEDGVLVGLGIFAAFFIVRDIRNLLGIWSSEDKIEYISDIQAECDEHANIAPRKTAQQMFKENPEWMMDLSEELEVRRGHKPTYEELVDYVDNEAFRIERKAEIDQEVKAMVEKARKTAMKSN